jgi:hypothetical protein
VSPPSATAGEPAPPSISPRASARARSLDSELAEIEMLVNQATDRGAPPRAETRASGGPLAGGASLPPDDLAR